MDMTFITALGSVAAALGTAAAVVVAVKALRASRRTALADQFLQAAGEMLAALRQMSDRAQELNAVLDGEQMSRRNLGETFNQFANASARLGLLDEVLSKHPDYGEWVRNVANNLAVNLLQADEFGPRTRRARARGQ